MKKLEQAFCTKLQRWLKYNMPWNFLWEAKVVDLETKKNYQYKCDRSFYKEMTNLLQAGRHVVHKFSDFGGMGTICDGFKLTNASGFFFIQFFMPRKHCKDFYIIEASVLNKYIKKHDPRSITEDICIKIGKIGELK